MKEVIRIHSDLAEADGIGSSSGFSKNGQLARFKVIYPYVRCSNSVLDYGCGNQAFLNYLTNNLWTGVYRGVDVNPIYESPNVIIGDVLDTKLPQVEVVVASGVFCYKTTAVDNSARLQRLWDLAEKTLVVNFLTTLNMNHSDKQWLQLHDPAIVVQWITEELDCRCYALHHDYLHNDFTVALSRNYKYSDVIAVT